MEQDNTYHTYLKQIAAKLSAKNYQKASDLCDEMKTHLFANPPVNPLILGWQRYYKFLCLLKLEKDKEALDLYLSQEEHPFVLDKIQSVLMTTMAAELACSLGDAKLTLKLARYAWTAVLPMKDPLQSIQKAQNACIFFDKLNKNRLNFSFARYLIGCGKSNNMPILILQGLECLESNYIESASLTIASMLLNFEGEVIKLLETPPEGVERLRVANLMDRIDKLPKRIAISGKFDEGLKLLEAGSLSALNALIKENPLIINENDDDGETLLFKAVEQCNYAAVQLLLEADSDVHRSERKTGSTPLLKAVEIGNAQIVEALLDQGADIEAKDNNGETPLIKSINEDRLEVMSVLLDYGAIVDRIDPRGYSALMYAAKRGNVDAVNQLVYAGADASQVSPDGKNLKELAQESGNEDCVKICEHIQTIFDNLKEKPQDSEEKAEAPEA